MMPFEEIELTVNTFHKLGLTVEAAQFLIETYHLSHPNFDSFELTEVAQPSFIVMVTIGALGQPQKIQIPKNVFEKTLVLTEDVDIDDTEFVALTEHIKGKFWSGDKALQKGLKNKGWNRFITTDQLFGIIDLK